MKSRTHNGAVRLPGVHPLRLTAALALACLAVGLSTSVALAAPAAPAISGPTALAFIQHPRGFRGAVSWDAVPTATSYRVYDADTSVLLATVTGTTYWVYGMQGTVYRRYVVAVDGVGETSSPSNTLDIRAVAPVPPPAPAGLTMLPSSIFDLRTSAPPTGMTEVRVPYDPVEVAGDPARLRLLHYTGTSWVDITTSVDTANTVVIGQTSSFSPFAVMESSGGPVTSTPASSDWSLALLVCAALGFVAWRARRRAVG